MTLPLINLLGPGLSTRVARSLARTLSDQRGPWQRVAAARLGAALGRDPGDPVVERAVGEMYEHIARFWVEVAVAPRRMRGTSWRGCIAVSEETALRLTAAARSGCVLATCYYGNPLAAAVAAGRMLPRVHAVMDFFMEPAARAWQKSLLDVAGIRPIPAASAAMAAADALRRGDAVMLMVEHRRRRGGVRAAFLGDDGPWQSTVGRLSEWFGVPVLPVLCRRTDELMRFELWAGRAVGGGTAADGTRAVLAQLDEQIRDEPAQYLWSVRPPA